jgi:hypothetical protein
MPKKLYGNFGSQSGEGIVGGVVAKHVRLVVILAIERTCLLEEIEEVRRTSQQTVASIQDRLEAAESVVEDIRAQHAQLLRHSQSRQTQLEKENAELVDSISEKQREVQRLQRLLESEGRDMTFREADGLRHQLDDLQVLLDEEREKAAQREKRVRMLECEYRAAQILWEDERQRSTVLVNEQSSEIAGESVRGM